MKIIELCTSNGFGGLELYAFHAGCKLREQGHECLPVIRKGGMLDKKFNDAQFNGQYLHAFTHHLPVITAKKLARIIDDFQADVIHMHWGKDLLLAVLAKKFARHPVKLVYTRQMALTRPKQDGYHRFLYGNVDKYIAITRQLQEDARRYLPMPASNIELLYYGVKAAQDSAADCSAFFSEHKLEQGKFTIALFGRIEEGKGQHLLLDALLQLTAQGKNIQVAFIGHIMDQAYFDGLMEIARERGVQSSFVYLGFHNNPVSIMPCFDVVVLASKAETFGLVLIEAMRAGTAVIGSRAGGVPEIIQHEKTGLLFESGNSEDLAAQLLKLIDAPAFCTEMAKNGKAYADEHFSEERHYQALENILRL